MPKAIRTETFELALKFCRDKGYIRKSHDVIARQPIACPGIDYLLGNGIPIGRITEISGRENSGKTTVAAEIARAFQNAGSRVLFIDFEHAVDLSYFKKLGVDVDDESKWVFLQPFCLEEGMDAAIRLVRTGDIGLLIVDSVAAMTPREEIEAGMESQQIGLQARGIGKALRLLVSRLESTSTAAVFINQLRDKIGGMIPGLSTTPGGRAPGYYASVRIELKKIKHEKFGSIHRAILRKQKTKYFQPCVVDFVIGKNGIDRDEALIVSLINVGILKNRKGIYFYNKKQIAGSRDKLRELLSREKVKDQFLKMLFRVWDKTDSEGMAGEI